MKSQADKRRTECEFKVREWVYLKLQPYMQQFVKTKNCQKLAAKWFGRFLILGKVGSMAYELKLPEGSKIHPVFHVTQLKKHLRDVPVQQELPIVRLDVSISKEPAKILERRIGKMGNQVVTEVLVEWTNSFPEDGSWENLHQLKIQFSEFNPNP
ncbi:hypothetical protein HRI_000888900 [Hibiscus trionum]|uniref:Tf2-1-like SH3-like domain-containing protein n=1 Tax=Hibiscus trionum TaxID=183268 RepID=A0A9W7H7D9_HIBTR|nr:hypothetical protein HRI_000888900 [Hibiscus trionum]